MADKTDKKPDAPAEKKDGPKAASAAAATPAHGNGSGGGGLLTKLPVMLGGVMIIEAIVLFAGFKFIGGGAKNANAADLTLNVKGEGTGSEANAADSKTPKVEIELLDARFPNKLSGREFLYDVSMFVSVKADNEDKVKKLIAANDALIKDRVRTIIAQSDPEKLGGGSEPGLETLRRQVKFQLDEIVGENMIDEVLVPRCIPFRADY